MSRLLFFIGLIVVVFFLLKSWHKKQQKDDQPADTITDDMVSCAVCGVHLPKKESVQQGGKFYCSTAHRDHGQ